MDKFIAVLVVFCLCLSTVNAGTRDPLVSDNKYVEYGADFTCVGKICGIYNDGTLFCASAVAIDDHNILTAAHVVKNAKSCKFYIENTEYCINELVIHKDFDITFGVGDIAIGYCEKSFNLNFYPSLYTDTDETGQICSMSGYGLTGTFNTGANLHDGKRRAGSNIIDKIEYDLLICSPSKPGEHKRTSLEFLIASGDSGGGLFIGNKLAGINSCVMAVDRSPFSKYNEESGHTRISKYIPWINEHKK